MQHALWIFCLTFCGLKCVLIRLHCTHGPVMSELKPSGFLLLQYRHAAILNILSKQSYFDSQINASAEHTESHSMSHFGHGLVGYSLFQT